MPDQRNRHAKLCVNRIDELVVFNKLEDEHLLKICGMLVRNTKRTVKSNTGCMLIYDNLLIEYMVGLERDTEYGARPLKRLIVEHLETPLADHLITRESDSKKVYVSVEDNMVKFTDAADSR